MPGKSSFSRRKFLSEGVLAAAGVAALGLPAFAQTSTSGHASTSAQTPTNGKTIRLGLIGSGSRGCGLASLVKEMPGIELSACCDIIPANLQEGMKIAGPRAKAYTDYRKLLEDKGLDAILIATPLFLHYQMAVDALDAGKHVYLEKSMTYDIPQVFDLKKKVQQSGQVLQVGYQYRYYGLYQKVKEIIDQHWLGRVTHYECQYNRNSNWRNPVSDPKLEKTINWRMYRAYCGGPLSELCAHEIDMVNYLTGAHPLRVTGMGGINYWKDGRDTYDNIRTIYEYPGGVKAAFNSVLSNAYNGYNIRILGDKATVEIQREKAFIYPESTENKRGTVDGVTGATIPSVTQGTPVEISFKKPGEEDLEPTSYALADFFECIRTGKAPVSNVITAGQTSIAIHLGNKAMDTQTWQSWQPEYNI